MTPGQIARLDQLCATTDGTAGELITSYRKIWAVAPDRQAAYLRLYQGILADSANQSVEARLQATAGLAASALVRLYELQTRVAAGSD